MNLLPWIQSYYIQNYLKSNDKVIDIYTVDNPGWRIKINLCGIGYETKTFKELSIDNGDDDWVFIKLKDDIFDGAGDKNKLFFMLSFFRDWCQNNLHDEIKYITNYDNDDLLYWIQKEWFCKLDFGWDGEEYHGVKIIAEPNGKWYVEIELLDTYLEDKVFNCVNVNNGSDDWVSINVINNIFKGNGDKNKLVFIIEKFREWAEQYK